MPKKKQGKREDPEILTFEPQADHGNSDLDSSSEDEELTTANEEGGNEEADKPPPLKPVLSPKEALGLRAIRLGAFKNKGEYRGWAYLDFDSAAHATAALIHLPNRYLFSRELELQFASIDATRRGGYVEDPENSGQYVYDFQGVPSKNGKKSSKSKDKRLRSSKKKRAQMRREERAREKARLLAEMVPVITPAPTAG
ncbi:hypothetical protein FRC00_000583 [Tulasnella sp. 408]|nr:hypothetical protein FRC00_000583 [Tulasnella sp. 408]